MKNEKLKKNELEEDGGGGKEKRKEKEERGERKDITSTVPLGSLINHVAVRQNKILCCSFLNGNTSLFAHRTDNGNS